MSFVCLVELELHLPEGGGLKAKRKEVMSLKEQLRRRFGATVAETAYHELWQRATLTAALVGREPRGLEDAAAALERHAMARIGDGVKCRFAIRSAEEVLG